MIEWIVGTESILRNILFSRVTIHQLRKLTLADRVYYTSSYTVTTYRMSIENGSQGVDFVSLYYIQGEVRSWFTKLDDDDNDRESVFTTSTLGEVQYTLYFSLSWVFERTLDKRSRWSHRDPRSTRKEGIWSKNYGRPGVRKERIRHQLNIIGEIEKQNKDDNIRR